MNIKLQLPKLANLRPRITVVGVGGAGSNAVNNMIASGLTGVTFAVANTDAQSLANSSADRHIQLGAALTEGLGAGARPEIGKAAAEEALEEIRAQVEGSHMVFVAAGMGGGTGTGAAAVIARVARECGALTVGVVTKPFQFEGTRRMRAAEIGVSALKPEVDTLIVIPNQNLFRIANERTTFADAFRLADQVLYSGIACVVDLIVKDGLINLDFADVRTVMSGMGTAMMGTGEAAGDRRAVTAAEEAISNPLLDDISLRGARGLLVSITGNRDMTLYEVDEAANRVRQEVDPEATIIVGATFDDTLADKIRVSIVASGMERLGEQAQPSWPPARVHSAEPVQAQPHEAQQSAPMAVEGAYQHPHPDQHMPQHPAEPAPGMRYAHDDAGLTRALSEALGMRPGPDQTAQPGHHAPWASQSGAVFAEAPAQLAPVAAEHHGYAYPDQHAAAESHGFSPQAPADAGRSPRRLPQVEDFPVVGQRDYNAKIGQYADPHAPAPPRAYAQPAPEPPPRKLGFFERLTGVRRRTTPGPAPANTPQAPYTHENHHRQSGGMDRTAPHERDQSAPRHAQDHVELPVFFGGGKK